MVADWLAELAELAELAAAAPREALVPSVASEKAEVGREGLAVDCMVAATDGWEAMASATVARRAASAQKEGAAGSVAP